MCLTFSHKNVDWGFRALGHTADHPQRQPLAEGPCGPSRLSYSALKLCPLPRPWPELPSRHGLAGLPRG